MELDTEEIADGDGGAVGQCELGLGGSGALIIRGTVVAVDKVDHRTGFDALHYWAGFREA